ncbi:MAG: sigma-70 family RNA polymerase sigma factor [Planctomycetes bacterium]|nr:sigma-70 family RNA polymerase sigma factor [Planctomycetota bacterium]
MTESRSELPPEALLAQAGFLRALAQGLLRDEHASEDVVQTTWLTALQRREHEIESPRAWMARVVRNLAFKRRRGEQRRAARERAVAKDEALSSSADAVERADTLRAVTDAVLALDEPYRSTILLRYFEGLELAEIAARTNEPLATVRSRHARALAQLRERLDREHGGERRAWALGLVGLVDGERAGLVGGGLGTAGSVTTGAVIVSTKIKLAVAAALVLAAFFAVRLGTSGSHGDSTNTRDATDVDLLRSIAYVGESKPSDAMLAAPTDATNSSASSARTPIATLGSIRVAVTWSDGTPAAGIVLNAFPWGALDPYLASFRVRTDEKGEARLEHLIPGRVGVYVDRGDGRNVDVRAGEEARATFAVPVGLEVAGRVVDPAGSAVADAEIWLSDYGPGQSGSTVATSDADGRFVLRDIPDAHGIGARKIGHSPSPTLWPSGSAGERREVVLILQGRGAALAVHVVGPDGEPVEGARVQISELDAKREGYEMYAHTQQPLTYLDITDAEGNCSVASLAPGKVNVVVSTSGLAPWIDRVVLETGGVTAKEVKLGAGVTVKGIASEPNGKPLEGVEIRVGEYGHFTTRQVKTRADGSYRLAAIAPGEFELEAWREGAGRDRTTSSGVDGEEVVWNPRIDPGRVLLGRIVDAHEQPLADWYVTVDEGNDGRDAYRGFNAQTRSDAEGHFRVTNCVEKPMRLEVREPDAARTFPAVEMHDVRAGEQELTIVIGDAMRATGWIEGRLVDASGAPKAAEVSLERTGTMSRASKWSDLATGAFRFGPCVPGTYSLSALGEKNESVRREGLELVSGATLDLGALRLGAAGRVEIETDVVEGVDPQRVLLLLLTPERQTVRFFTADETPGAIELPVGNYVLDVQGGCAAEHIEFAITADETTRLHVTPRRAVRAVLRFHLPAGRALPLNLELVFRPSDGGAPYSTHAWLQHQEGLPPELDTLATIFVPPASRYTLDVSGPDGLRGSAEIDGARLQREWSRDELVTEVVLR